MLNGEKGENYRFYEKPRKIDDKRKNVELIS